MALALAASACAPKLANLPSGPGSAFPEFPTAYQQAVEPCRGVRTLAAVLEISGRAAGQRFPRASIDAGFEAPDKAMLELPAPGRPFFTFAASGGTSTLILPRENRVLQNAPPEDALEALTGIRLGPAELRAIVSGCGFGVIDPAGGRSFDARRAAVDGRHTGSDVTAYLERAADGWQLVAMSRCALEVRYSAFASGRPSAIRLRSATSDTRGRTDLTIRPSQVDINQPIQPQAFAPELPRDAKPLTLDELRKAGPLGR
jgi:hypothetical protein